MTQENSLRIDFLKFVCAILVVCIHCGWTPDQPWSGWTLDGPWSLGWILNQSILWRCIPQIAVPFFFLCSGYFLAKHLSAKNEWWEAVRKRVWTIGGPFVIWLLISDLFLPLGVCFVRDVFMWNLSFPSSTAFLQDFDWLGIIKSFFYRIPIVQLWYLKALFLFVLLAPLVASCVKRFRWKWLVFCFILSILFYLSSSVVFCRFFGWNCPLKGLFYFSCGIYFYYKPVRIPSGWRASGGWGGVALALIVVRLFLVAHGYEICSRMIEDMMIPFMLYATWNLTPAKKLPRWIANMSFPIYLMHISVFICVDPLLRQIPFEKSASLIFSFIRLLIGVGGSIFMTHLLRRYCPRFAKLAFGER